MLGGDWMVDSLIALVTATTGVRSHLAKSRRPDGENSTNETMFTEAKPVVTLSHPQKQSPVSTSHTSIVCFSSVASALWDRARVGVRE